MFLEVWLVGFAQPQNASRSGRRLMPCPNFGHGQDFLQHGENSFQFRPRRFAHRNGQFFRSDRIPGLDPAANGFLIKPRYVSDLAAILFFFFVLFCFGDFWDPQHSLLQ